MVLGFQSSTWKGSRNNELAGRGGSVRGGCLKLDLFSMLNCIHYVQLLKNYQYIIIQLIFSGGLLTVIRS